MEDQSVQNAFAMWESMSRLFQNQPGATAQEQPHELEENAKKIMAVMELFKQTQQQPVNGEKTVSYNAPDFLQSIKIFAPFLPLQNQDAILMFVKMMEIKQLLDQYKNYAMQMQNSEQPGDWRRNILDAIHPHMTGEKQYQIELFIHLLEMQELLNKMKEVSTHGNQ